MKSELSPITAHDLEVLAHSNSLNGVEIGLCVGGGIAALEAPRLIRELRRKGAHVRIYATTNSLKFVGRDALEWASTRPVITEGSGLAEHIAQEHIVVVIPATADLIGKAALGICPDTCSTYIQSALGMKKQVLFLPTMHESLSESPAFKQNLQTLSRFDGVEILQPRIEEGKWKIPSIENLATEIAFRFNRKKRLSQKKKTPKALVTLGGTIVPLDSARAISNFSTGTLGASLIEILLEKGIEVVALCAAHTARLPECSGLTKINHPFFSDFQNWLKNERNLDGIHALFHLAAISDFGSSAPTNVKISSAEPNLKLNLKQLPKLIQLPTLRKLNFKIACKYTNSNSRQEREKALRLLKENSLDGVYWNWGESAFGASMESSGILFRDESAGQIEVKAKKEASAAMASFFEEKIQNSLGQKKK